MLGEDKPQPGKKEKYKPEKNTMFTYMDWVANLRSAPKAKFKELKGYEDGVKEYEFRSKHLRIYVFDHPNSKIVVLGGHKNDQGADIGRFRSLKRQFIESLNQ